MATFVLAFKLRKPIVNGLGLELPPYLTQDIGFGRVQSRMDVMEMNCAHRPVEAIKSGMTQNATTKLTLYAAN